MTYCLRYVPLKDRFDMQYIPVPESGCWLWTGAVKGTGYGSIRAFGKTEGAHRVSWMLNRGPIPPRMYVCHKCDTPLCVNPNHLFLGTYIDNAVDRQNKGRTLSGENCGQAKITDAQLKEICESTEKPCDIAARFGISRKHVWRLRSTGNRSGKYYGAVAAHREQHPNDPTEA